MIGVVCAAVGAIVLGAVAGVGVVMLKKRKRNKPLSSSKQFNRREESLEMDFVTGSMARFERSWIE